MASIAGQTEGYLFAVMDEWRKGERFSTVMGRLLAGYTEEQIKALAA
jgi:sulfide dehydrogenase cytochrome subunit